MFAKTLEEQRQNYLAAKKTLNNKQYNTFAKITNTLKDYPLYPYLRYEYLRKRLWQVKDEEMIQFFANHSDLPMIESLRTAWLKLLVHRGHWQTFLENYVPQSNVKMQCYQLQARMKTSHDHSLLENIRTIWLAGKSLPPECDPAFELLYKSNVMTNELIWERIRLAMQNNQIGLTNYLKRKLHPKYQKLAQSWINMHKNPYKNTTTPKLENSETGREILIHGILRIARQNIKKAVQRFNGLKTQYSFLPGEIVELERTLAIRAAKAKHPLAKYLLDQIDHYHINDEVFHYRLNIALREQDWPLLRRWTNPNIMRNKNIKLRWDYWHARALEKTGDTNKATMIYTELAKERDYYGFLAADKMNLPYQMNHYPLQNNQEELDRIASLPAIKRAYELYQLGIMYPARREWHHALNKMTHYQMQMAALLATQWGWYNRAIFTLAQAESYNDLVLRFPIIFSELLNKYANKYGLDPSWVFGLVRAESAFIEDVRSPAGALGLMQIMPKTGQRTAKSIGIKHFHPNKLKQAKINIPIGSAYMKQMLNRFNGNMVLATAAYNAGPNRVIKWLPKRCAVLADIWVEQIPFNETRKYVRRVLYFTNIYDWRLNNKIKSLKERMPLITTNQSGLVTPLNCVSENSNVN